MNLVKYIKTKEKSEAFVISEDNDPELILQLLRDGEIYHIIEDIYIRPKIGKYIKKVVPPSVSSVIELMAKRDGEPIQTNSGVALNRLGLSLQVPVRYVYHTNWVSREIKINENNRVKMLHEPDIRFFQHFGTPMGLAISALWSEGENIVTPEYIAIIKTKMSLENFKILKSSDLPSWLSNALNCDK